MHSAKDILLKPISSRRANRIVKRLHYSGKVVNNSQLHIGVFLNGSLEGAMQFGPPFDKRKALPLVEDTEWNGMMELNRMAFSDRLPRNSESRAISVAMKLMKKHAPHVEWILSYSDATQCGDGAIYRASGFVLTGIKENKSMLVLPNGDVVASHTLTKGKHILRNGGKAAAPEGAEALQGYQLRYIYFINPEARKRLTVPEIPFEKIDEIGAGMYRGEKMPYHKRNQDEPAQEAS